MYDEDKGLGERLLEGTLNKVVKHKIAAGLLGASVLASPVLYHMCTEHVEPGEHAIKETVWSPAGLFGDEGPIDNTLGPGTYFVIPMAQRIHTFPSDMQVIDHNQNYRQQIANELAEYSTPARPVRIETSEGLAIDLDATIHYRVDDPYEALTEFGPGNLYETAGVLQRTESALKATLGQLSPEEFLIPAERLALAEQAVDRLNTELEDAGIYIQDIRIRWPDFDDIIQARFEDRALASENELYQRERQELNEITERYNALVRDGERQVNEIDRRAQAYETVRRSEADSYATERRSDATTLVELARAESSELINNAYQGTGSELLIGLQMAENLANLEYILVPAGEGGFNPLDLSSVTQQITSDYQQRAQPQADSDQTQTTVPLAPAYQGGNDDE